jgi:hypothetical protein
MPTASAVALPTRPAAAVPVVGIADEDIARAQYV